MTEEQKKLDCETAGVWYESQGYRHIPGDQCQGGLWVAPKARSCGASGIVSSILHPFSSGTTQAPAAPAPTEQVGLGEPATSSESQPSGAKNLIVAAIVIAVLYYGWPIIEAIILILPIPNPQGVVDNLKAVGNIVLDVVNGIMKSDT